MPWEEYITGDTINKMKSLTAILVSFLALSLMGCDSKKEAPDKSRGVITVPAKTVYEAQTVQRMEIINYMTSHKITNAESLSQVNYY